MIRNPNEIVTELVGDFSEVYSVNLQSVILYGSAVSHEYVPGKSPVSLLVILSDTAMKVMHKAMDMHYRWIKRGLAVPRFITPEQVMLLAEVTPVEFVSMKLEYRVLYGIDVLTAVTISRKNLHRQCQCMFFEIIRQCIERFIADHDQKRHLEHVLVGMFETLMPLFKAILVLYEQKVPHVATEQIAAFEDLFGLGSSVFSEVFIASGSGKKSIVTVFEKFYDTIINVQAHLAALRIPDDTAAAAT